MKKRTFFNTICLIVSVAVLGLAIVYGSGDEGSVTLWGIMVVSSLIGIFWGLKGLFMKSTRLDTTVDSAKRAVQVQIVKDAKGKK